MDNTGKTRSELFREALTLYLDNLEFESLTKYGERQAARLNIQPNDVERLVGEVRQQ